VRALKVSQIAVRQGFDWENIHQVLDTVKKEIAEFEYALEKEATENSLASGYEMAVFELQNHRQLIALYRKQIKTTQQSLNLLLASYENSGNAFEEVLRMQQQLLKYKKQIASSEAAYLTALAKLNYLTAKTYDYETYR